MFISSKCVSGANETNCALNEMSPTGLWNSLSPGLAGLHGVSAYPLQGKLAARWLTRRGKVLPGSRPHGSSPGESASLLRGKLKPARPGLPRTHGVYGPRVNPFDINQFRSIEINIL